MTKIGFHAGQEQHSPSALLRYTLRAQQAGFTTASCSDHLHPWSERQGHSGFSWSWLGGALQATSLPIGVVCAPGGRYHPAIVAQAVATLLEMFPGRFWIAVGSGESLNEVVTGEPWPEKPVRNARLKESWTSCGHSGSERRSPGAVSSESSAQRSILDRRNRPSSPERP